ncbi:unnamed protein product [Ectocarpus fasciculatus]
MVLPVILAGPVISSAAASIISGKACHPGDADCLGDETDHSYFYSFIYMCHIFLMCAIFRTLWAAPIWVAGALVAALGRAREWGFVVRPGRRFQLLVIWP